MLPERDRELLTAAIDAELNAGERSHVKRLLQQSEEARVLFARLKKDALRVRALPRVAAPSDIATSVMRAITEEGITPTPLPPERHRKRFAWNNPAAWAGMAAAAAVLLTVSVTTYLYFVASRDDMARSQSSLVSKNAPSILDAHTRALPPQGNTPSTPRQPELAPVPREMPTAIAKIDPELLPEPRTLDPITSGATLPAPEFELMKFRMSLILPLRDLDQAYPKRKLREEIVKDDIIRLDLFCKDSLKGVELLQAALKAKGHQLVIDPVATDRIKKKVRGEFVFYTESFTAEEVAGLLEQLGADDRKAEQKKAGEGQFDKFVLAPFLAVDLERLARLLGVPASQLKLPSRKTPSVDIRKPISDTTVTQIPSNLGKGPTPVAKANDKLTLIVPYSTSVASVQSSKEVKQYLEKRGERKSGTTPLMLVLRAVGP